MIQAFATPGEVSRILLDLFATYFTHAWPFFLIHLFVGYTVFRLRGEINVEVTGLKRWMQGGEARGECARALSQFTEECRQWGARGVLVPMTDFSDRLDSHVTGQIENLHSRVNLFLVVGVAGTFFAMFQFAMNAAGMDRGGIAAALREGLVQAFPVGFFGLMLSIVGHYVASGLETKFRGAVHEATQHAIQQRFLLSSSLVDVLNESLKPVKELHKTLSETLRPVMDGFREELKEVSGSVRNQVQPLAEAVQGFRAATESLKEPSRMLTEAARDLPAAMASVASTVGAIRADMEETGRTLREAVKGLEAVPRGLTGAFDAGLKEMSSSAQVLWADCSREFFEKLEPARKALDSSASELSLAASALANVPGQVSAAADDMVAEFGKQTAALSENAHQTWKDTGERFLRVTSENVAAQWGKIAEDSKQAGETLQSAAGNLNRVSQEVSNILEGTVKELFERAERQLQPHLKELDEAVRARYPQLLENLTRAAAEAKELSDHTEKMGNDFAEVAGRVEAAAKRWDAAAQRFEKLLQAPGTTDQVRQAGEELRAIAAELSGLRAFLSERFGDLPVFPVRRRKGATLI